MKKCPYCNHMNEDEANVCEKCFAGFPHEEKNLPDDTNEIRVSGKGRKIKKEMNTDGT